MPLLLMVRIFLFDRAIHGVAEREVPGIQQIRTHAVGNVPIADPGVRVGESGRASRSRKSKGARMGERVLRARLGKTNRKGRFRFQAGVAESAKRRNGWRHQLTESFL